MDRHRPSSSGAREKSRWGSGRGPEVKVEVEEKEKDRKGQARAHNALLFGLIVSLAALDGHSRWINGLRQRDEREGERERRERCFKLAGNLSGWRLGKFMQFTARDA